MLLVLLALLAAGAGDGAVLAGVLLSGDLAVSVEGFDSVVLAAASLLPLSLEDSEAFESSDFESLLPPLPPLPLSRKSVTYQPVPLS